MTYQKRLSLPNEDIGEESAETEDNLLDAVVCKAGNKHFSTSLEYISLYSMALVMCSLTQHSVDIMHIFLKYYGIS